MKNRIKERMNSDMAASNTVETIIIIALAVFAALALFTYILTPVQNNAEELGTSIDKGVNSLINSAGDSSTIDFSN